LIDFSSAFSLTYTAVLIWTTVFQSCSASQRQNGTTTVAYFLAYDGLSNFRW